MDIANAGLVHRLDARHSSSRDLDNIGPIQSYIDLSILLLGVLLKGWHMDCQGNRSKCHGNVVGERPCNSRHFRLRSCTS
jgi:hypothetical protein